jgi:methionyl-tRNA synthetase
MENKFYITTTLPYINADPHIGFALEVVQADVLARFHRQESDKVFFNTGTDEHGAKVFQKASELGMDAQTYCNEKVQKFIDLKNLLNLSFDSFTRTTDEQHKKAAQEFWKRCEAAGDIYKKNYKIKYCVGCELEKTESDLVDCKCPLHPNMELEIIEEENYFFKFSNYQNKLLVLYKNNSEFVVPEKKFNEIKSFTDMGLQDFSISRLKSKMPWGIEVPGDGEQVMYVWFDALVNYVSAIGWPDNLENFNRWWPAVQLAGKDNLRQQSAMWQAMLFSAGIENSKQVFINGFVNVGGQKMSKSLGNVVSPTEMVEKFGVDATRYLLLTLGDNFGEDMDFTWERMTEKYNADLANGLGNITSRIIKLSENIDASLEVIVDDAKKEALKKNIDEMELSRALQAVWNIIRENDKYISDTKPWELKKTDAEKFKKIMQKLFDDLNLISVLLIPFMPETAEKIKKALEAKQVEILFPRIK